MSDDRYGTQAKYVTKRNEVLFNFLIHVHVCCTEDLRKEYWGEYVEQGEKNDEEECIMRRLINFALHQTVLR